MGRVCSVPLLTVAFWLRVVPESSPVIMGMKNSGSLSRQYRRSRHIPPIGLLLSREVLWNHLGANFSHAKHHVKIWGMVNQFKCNSLLIIINVNQQSDLTRDLTLSTKSYIFEVEGLPE
jgi:hypothetical protein